MLDVRSVVDHTEWKTTGPWLDAAKPTPSPILLGRRLQMALLVLMPSSV